MSGAYPLKRDVEALRASRPDVLVVGGGIYGAWIACDAAQRGLSVVLVERDDFGAGTSSASSKLIHGGLRYLEHYEFKLVRHALAERRVLTHIAPHLVRPLRFVLPVWRGARVGRLQLKAGLTLYDWLARGEQPVAPHRSFSAQHTAQRYPMLQSDGLRGALSYGDCQEDDARMTLAVVAAAQHAGALVANRVSVEALLDDADGRVRGARLHDRVDDSRFELDARCVVNAAGPWAPGLAGRDGPTVKLVKGAHMVMPPIPDCEEAFLLTAPQDGRVFFVIPWYGRTLVGTTESEVSSAAEAQVNDADIDYLLTAVSHGMPGLGWTRADVQGAFAGVRTLQAADQASLSAVSREFAVVQPRPGLVQPIGGKYTTARVDAEDVVKAVYAELGRHVPLSLSATLPLPGTPTLPFDAWLPDAVAGLRARGADDEAARFAALRHGTHCAMLGDLIDADAELARRLDPRAPFLRAEVVLAVRDEMALSLDDILRRRMPLSLLAPLSPAVLADAAALAAVTLGWDDARCNREIDALLRAQPTLLAGAA